MANPPPPGTGACLEINSPLSRTSLDRLVKSATAHQPLRITDHGCGWGTALLALLAAAPRARGVGVDPHGPDITRAQEAAAAQGLEGRVDFRKGRSIDHPEPGDLLINMGAFDAFGTPREALDRLGELLLPSGRLLFGIEYWRATPTDDELAVMWPEASVDDCLPLPGVAELAHEAGWQILDLHDSTQTEFDAFELGHLREREEWALHHPGHPVRAELAEEWAAWLRGRRRPMGFVTMLLGRS